MLSGQVHEGGTCTVYVQVAHGASDRAFNGFPFGTLLCGPSSVIFFPSGDEPRACFTDGSSWLEFGNCQLCALLTEKTLKEEGMAK
jgi:hypothetical protein